ncbi:hypothetical protein ES288_A10G111500v1 [Gossypium darwinii]|uniref:Uncharacterized protein n=1 Tax=Gossypium darwinii TaxID=34276 RepID=A0A5D2EZD5_GOSDA|nr:hypothetical protein ES288_A10G111500v1 [Gossypium darwinii]
MDIGKALQFMGLCVHGCVGRLAFPPPPRILADLPFLRHFFCCKSSSIMPRAYLNGEVDEESQNAVRNDTQLLLQSTMLFGYLTYKG